MIGRALRIADKMVFNAFRDQKRLVGDCRTIFDVGANKGDTARIYSRMFPNATIYAFEPEPSMAERLCAISGVTVVLKAVSDTDGQEAFHVFKDKATCSLLPVASTKYVYPPEAMQEDKVVTIPVTTIDRFCERLGIETLDILKLDIQGAEIKALQGAEQMLHERRIKLIYAEALFVPIYKYQAEPSALFNLMHGHGYKLYGIYDLCHAKDGRLRWCDLLFVEEGK